MTRGTIVSYNPEKESGYIDPDEDDDDKIPFDLDSLVNFPEGTAPRVGDRVRFQVEGGMAGVWATHVERID